MDNTVEWRIKRGWSNGWHGEHNGGWNKKGNRGLYSNGG